MARVVDTDVFSFFLKNDTRADLYRSHLRGHLLFLSFMTVAEIENWSLRAAWGDRRKREMNKNLRRVAIQNSNREICRLWAQVKDEGRRTGFNIDDADAWIAATALYFDVSLVTHNAADFQNVGNLNIISEK
jgi:tRNA(fMet)-specific endonuclease VapC